MTNDGEYTAARGVSITSEVIAQAHARRYFLFMSPTAARSPVIPRAGSNPFGALLREWRGVRNWSQLSLALDANISQRHLSFIESGRSTPSRDMILRIAETLDLPLRARNELLTAAGYAAAFSEQPLDANGMREVRKILSQMLAHHEPYPAMVLDRSWNYVMRNAANERIATHCLRDADHAEVYRGARPNFLRAMFAEHGMHRHVRNWARTGPALLARLRREARAYPGSPSEALLNELTAGAPPGIESASDEDSLTPTIPLELDISPGVVLRLTNTLTTFGTPQDVSVQELRVEMSYPLDDASDHLLREWAQRGRI